MWQKTADQKKALKLLGSNVPNILLYGGSRSGKTFILVYAMIVRALKVPASRHIILRYRGNSVIRSIRMDTFDKVMKLAFPQVAFKEDTAEGFVQFGNGSEIWFGGLDTGDRSDRILGREFATIYFNECSELQYDAVNTALTRLAQKTALENKAYFDCNPCGRSHWTYQLFINHCDPVSHAGLSHPEFYEAMLMNPDGNRENLPASYIERTLMNLSERQKKRFLFGEWAEDVEGALWKSSLIDRSRLLAMPVKALRTVIGVDPAVSSNDLSDMTGIVVCSAGTDGNFYVLGDYSMRGKPIDWCRKIAELFHKYQASAVIAEVNNGGELIESLLRTIDAHIPFTPVRAFDSKIRRAELASALYEQGKVHHIGRFPELEDQMCSYSPALANQSPDRMDALVWAIRDLLSKSSAKRFIIA